MPYIETLNWSIEFSLLSQLNCWENSENEILRNNKKYKLLFVK